MELKQAVEEYIFRKRMMGRRYDTNAKEFQMFVGNNPGLTLSEVRTTHVSQFLNGSRLVRHSWISRYSRMRAFFRYWMAKHQILRLPMPSSRRPTKQMFAPYIYSRSDIKKMLRKAETQNRKLCMVCPDTFRQVVILLYGTGMGLEEALTLRVKDFDPENRTLRLSARLGPARTIPIGTDLVDMFGSCIDKNKYPDDYLFTTKQGRKIRTHRMNVTFRRIRRISAIRRTDGATYQPMLRDLRHTFAVHRIADWYKLGIDVELMLPETCSVHGTLHRPPGEPIFAASSSAFQTANCEAD